MIRPDLKKLSQFATTCCYKNLTSRILTSSRCGKDDDILASSSINNPVRIKQRVGLCQLGQNDSQCCRNCSQINDSIWNAAKKSAYWVPDNATSWFEKERETRRQRHQTLLEQCKLFGITSATAVTTRPTNNIKVMEPIRNFTCAAKQQLDPKDFKRISPEFLKLLQQYDDTMAKKNPSYCFSQHLYKQPRRRLARCKKPPVQKIQIPCRKNESKDCMQINNGQTWYEPCAHGYRNMAQQNCNEAPDTSKTLIPMSSSPKIAQQVLSSERQKEEIVNKKGKKLTKSDKSVKVIEEDGLKVQENLDRKEPIRSDETIEIYKPSSGFCHCYTPTPESNTDFCSRSNNAMVPTSDERCFTADRSIDTRTRQTCNLGHSYRERELCDDYYATVNFIASKGCPSNEKYTVLGRGRFREPETGQKPTESHEEEPTTSGYKPETDTEAKKSEEQKPLPYMFVYKYRSRRKTPDQRPVPFHNNTGYQQQSDQSTSKSTCSDQSQKSESTDRITSSEDQNQTEHNRNSDYDDSTSVDFNTDGKKPQAHGFLKVLPDKNESQDISHSMSSRLLKNKKEKETPTPTSLEAEQKRNEANEPPAKKSGFFRRRNVKREKGGGGGYSQHSSPREGSPETSIERSSSTIRHKSPCKESNMSDKSGYSRKLGAAYSSKSTLKKTKKKTQMQICPHCNRAQNYSDKECQTPSCLFKECGRKKSTSSTTRGRSVKRHNNEIVKQKDNYRYGGPIDRKIKGRASEIRRNRTKSPKNEIHKKYANYTTIKDENVPSISSSRFGSAEPKTSTSYFDVEDNVINKKDKKSTTVHSNDKQEVKESYRDSETNKSHSKLKRRHRSSKRSVSYTSFRGSSTGRLRSGEDSSPERECNRKKKAIKKQPSPPVVEIESDHKIGYISSAIINANMKESLSCSAKALKKPSGKSTELSSDRKTTTTDVNCKRHKLCYNDANDWRGASSNYPCRYIIAGRDLDAKNQTMREHRAGNKSPSRFKAKNSYASSSPSRHRICLKEASDWKGVNKNYPARYRQAARESMKEKKILSEHKARNTSQSRYKEKEPHRTNSRHDICVKDASDWRGVKENYPIRYRQAADQAAKDDAMLAKHKESTAKRSKNGEGKQTLYERNAAKMKTGERQVSERHKCCVEDSGNWSHATKENYPLRYRMLAAAQERDAKALAAARSKYPNAGRHYMEYDNRGRVPLATMYGAESGQRTNGYRLVLQKNGKGHRKVEQFINIGPDYILGKPRQFDR